MRRSARLSSPIGRRSKGRRSGTPVAGQAPALLCCAASGRRGGFDDDFRQTRPLLVRGLAAAASRRPVRPAARDGIAARGRAAPHRAIYDLKLAQTRGNSDRCRRAGEFSTISPAMPAMVTRCSSAKCRSSTTERARSRSAICAPPPGKTARRRSTSSNHRTISTRHWPIASMARPSASPTRSRSALPSRRTRNSTWRPPSSFRPIICAASSRPHARQDLSGIPGLRRFGQRREGLQHAYGHRPGDRAERAPPHRCGGRQGSARRPQALAGHGELFRPGRQEAATRRRSIRSSSSSTRTVFPAR